MLNTKKGIKTHYIYPHIGNVLQTHSGFYTVPQMKQPPYRKSVFNNESHFNAEEDTLRVYILTRNISLPDVAKTRYSKLVSQMKLC